MTEVEEQGPQARPGAHTEGVEMDVTTLTLAQLVVEYGEARARGGRGQVPTYQQHRRLRAVVDELRARGAL